MLSSEIFVFYELLFVFYVYFITIVMYNQGENKIS